VGRPVPPITSAVKRPTGWSTMWADRRAGRRGVGARFYGGPKGEG